LQNLSPPNTSTQSNTASSIFLCYRTQSNTPCKLSTAWRRAEFSGTTVKISHISGQCSHLTRIPQVQRLLYSLCAMFWTQSSRVQPGRTTWQTKYKEIWHSEDRALWYIVIIKANKMHCLSVLFW
jgi:hypothetical protein